MRSSCAAGDTGLGVGELAELVFCSYLQPSQRPTPHAVRNAVREHLVHDNDPIAECAAHVASCYGNDPEGACQRMRWARSAVIATFFAGQTAA